MSAKFHSKRTIETGGVKVEIGRRSNKPAFKITTSFNAFIVDDAEANALGDAIDEALDVFDSDPLLWV